MEVTSSNEKKKLIVMDKKKSIEKIFVIMEILNVQRSKKYT